MVDGYLYQNKYWIKCAPRPLFGLLCLTYKLMKDLSGQRGVSYSYCVFRISFKLVNSYSSYLLFVHFILHFFIIVKNSMEVRRAIHTTCGCGQDSCIHIDFVISPSTLAADKIIHLNLRVHGLPHCNGWSS